MTNNDVPRTRRAALRAALATVAAGLTAATATRQAKAQTTEKLAQSVVQYQTNPKDGAKCSLCVNFQPPNACTIVAGEINPNGWCVAYAPKNS